MRPLCVASLLALSACDGSLPATPRLADDNEAAGVISALANRTLSNDREICFTSEITPALQDQHEVRDAFENEKDTGDEDAKSWFIPVYPPQPQPVEAALGRELESKLRQALKIPLGKKSRLKTENILPRRLVSKDPRPELPCGRSGMTQYTVSEPVIVGDIAFIENGGVCGGLCGGGSIEAYRKIDGEWHMIALKPVWLS